MCIRDRCDLIIFFQCLLHAAQAGGGAAAAGIAGGRVVVVQPVSYTHLDVYKRQEQDREQQHDLGVQGQTTLFAVFAQLHPNHEAETRCV